MLFRSDLMERDEILAALDMLAAKVGRRLRNKGLAGHTVTVKVRYHNLQIHTAQRTVVEAIDNERQMMPIIHELVDEVWAPGAGLRLVGVGVSDFGARSEQLSLFDLDDASGSADAANDGGGLGGGHNKSGRGTDERRRAASRARSSNLAKATDAVKDRFGEKAVRYGRELRFDGKDTGTLAQNKDEADLKYGCPEPNEPA